MRKHPGSRFKITCVTLAVLGLLGCSSASLQQRALSDAPWSGTAILLNYDLIQADGTAISDGCTLVFTLKGVGDESISLPAGTDRALVDAPAGRYSWKSISCSHFTRWMLNSLSDDGFTVVPGKIGFVGRISFRFPPKGEDVLTAEIGKQESATQTLAIDLQSLPKQWSAAVENPYTQKPITQAMLAPKGIYRMQIHVHEQLAPGMKSLSTHSLERSLNRCDQDEQTRFPYRIGSLNEVATYEDGKLKNLDETGANSFSDGFLSCLRKSFHAFAPPPHAQLTVTVVL